MNIRAEQPEDRAGVFNVNSDAFETPAEAGLVDALRAEASPVISLVAENAGRIIGHIMFSPATLVEHPELKIMGLAPVAVIKEKQRAGIGGQLIRAGLEQCKNAGAGAVIVLGHPEYYPRFGFLPALSTFGIKSKYDVPDNVFMALELQPGYLKNASGLIQYHPAFDRFD